jgi:hypothetical protein
MEYTINLTSSENKDLIAYCKLNNLNIDEILKKSYVKGFNIEKYGLLSQNEVVEKEVIKEIIKTEYVEVPVEKEIIKEVIKKEYIEVPIEIIKEIPIINNEDSEKNLNIIQGLKTKITELESVIETLPKIEYVNVPIEKEIVVEKIINDDKSIKKIESLQNTVQKIREELIEKETQLDECNKILNHYKLQIESQKAIYLRGSNLNKTL